MTDYKPGQIAKATVRGVPDVTVMRCGTANRGEFWWTPTYVDDARLQNDDKVTDVRPLVVLDPYVASYAATALEGSADSGDRYCAKQIREALPRPALSEPMRLGAVVEDTAGALWVRVLRPGGPAPWRKAQAVTVNCWASWQSIHVVRVVPPEELIDS